VGEEAAGQPADKRPLDWDNDMIQESGGRDDEREKPDSE
jgi:hypothetical protein